MPRENGDVLTDFSGDWGGVRVSVLFTIPASVPVSA